MGFKLGKLLKRVARSKVLRAGLSVATGGLSDKALSVGKSIGAAVTGNRMLKRQQKAVKFATEKLAKAPAPGLKSTPGLMGGQGFEPQARGKRRSAAKKKPARAAKAAKAAKGARGGKARSTTPPSTKRETKRARGSTGGGRVPPKQTAETMKKFAANASAMKAKGAAWKKMSAEERAAAGGWKSFAFGK